MWERTRQWWRRWTKAGQGLATVAAARREGWWPAAAALPDGFAGRKVLCVRRDRFGDAMVSVPFLDRLAASGAESWLWPGDGISRRLLGALGQRCVGDLDAARALRPDWLLFLQACRHLRASRYPERWAWLREVCEAFPGTPAAIVCWRRAEAMADVTALGKPWSGSDRIAELARFADALGLPPAESGLFAGWRAPLQTRRTGALVINLSAGAPGVEDRREVPIAFWAEVHARLRERVAATACVVLPGDEERRADFERSQAQGAFRGCTLKCEPDIVEVARWLARQRLLLSPETGMCHLARNLGLPMLVLSPARLVPYWYPAAPTTRVVCARELKDASLPETIAAAEGMLSSGVC